MKMKIYSLTILLSGHMLAFGESPTPHLSPSLVSLFYVSAYVGVVC